MVVREVKEIVKHCKRWREKSGYTQKEVGKMVKYSQKTISAFELGKINNLIIYDFYVNNFKE